MTCLDAPAVSADGLTSLDDLGFTGEDVQSRVQGFGFANEEVVLESTDFLLGDGPCGDRTGQSGGGS